MYGSFPFWGCANEVVNCHLIFISKVGFYDLWISEMKGRFIPSLKNWFNDAFRFKGCPNCPPLSKYVVKHRSLTSDFS